MELALGALGGLAPKLADLLNNEDMKQKGLKPDIEALSRELVVMHAHLQDVSRVPREKLLEVDKVMARKVRELAYDMEDAIDTFVVRVAGREPATDDVSVFTMIGRKAADIVKSLIGSDQLAERVKDIKSISKELADLCANYRFNCTANPTGSTGLDPRLLNMYKSEAELIGIEEPRDELIKRLMTEGGDGSLKIVSIVGFGGLGKSALAKTVQDRLKDQFDCRAFVSVGRNPHIASVLKKLLEKLDKNKYNGASMSGWDYEQLSEELQEFLHDRRFFIVIDDIWDMVSWKRILYSLKDSNCGSRIIMTTRNSEVVTKGEDFYKLRPLSHQNSKILFNKRILSGEGECIAYQADELLDKILRKCDGVPLAIIAMASLLAEKPWQEWSEVYDTIVSGRHIDGTMEIISYSYEDLPSYLKPCLLSMSMFQEDSEIWKYELIWMWIGEGFVQIKKEGDSILEQGERYFNELLNRSMIQPTEDDTDCTIDGCRLHDIVYDLISKLSREENFTTISIMEQCTSSDTIRRKIGMDFPSSSMKVRRLSLQKCHFEHIPHDTLGMPDMVRSLYMRYSTIHAMPQLYRFQVCRVLFIEDSNIPKLEHLGKLLHLKYPEINRTHVDKLPTEIADLKSLQTLLLTDIGPHELPSEVCALTTLMCMHITGFKRLPTDRMGNLVYLEELVLHPVEGRPEANDLVVQLGKLSRLRVLHIKFAEQIEESLQNALVNSINNLEKLQDLKLSFPKWMDASAAWKGWVPPRQLWRLLIPDITFSRLPVWISPSRVPRLSNLDVTAHVVKEQDLENLARLTELCYLRLQGLCINQGRSTIGATSGFKKLRVCNVGTAFKFEQGAMPSLEKLGFRVLVAGRRRTVDGVEHEILPTKDALGDLDLALGNLPSLKHVTIFVNCRGARASDLDDAGAEVRRVAEDHPKHPTFSIKRMNEHLMLSGEEAKEVEDFHTSVRDLKDSSYELADYVAFLRRYPWLQKATFHIDCEDATLCEVEEVEADLRKAADVHPKRPTLEIVQVDADKMVSTSDCCNSEGYCRHDDDDSVSTASQPSSPTKEAEEQGVREDTEDKQDSPRGLDNCERATLGEVEQVEAMLMTEAVAAHLECSSLESVHVDVIKMVSTTSDDQRNADAVGSSSLAVAEAEAKELSRQDAISEPPLEELPEWMADNTTEWPDEQHRSEIKPKSDRRQDREKHDNMMLGSQSQSNMQDDSQADSAYLRGRISQPQPLMDIFQDSKCFALEKALDDETLDPVDVPFWFLKVITKDFSDDQRIGSGGFGTVYKGMLPNGMVAVKQLRSKFDILEENFESEVACLIEVKHKNIVRFLGYCSETQQVLVSHKGRHILADVRQRLFCFEYLSKGSLANYLHEASSGLQWRVHYQIIKGICKGLGYLHHNKIIHMDLKPENILLDDNMVPKIADFGLSRRLNGNQSKAITKVIVGTQGYMAPEFIGDGIITLKTDIFSLGCIIIYILMGYKECSDVDLVLERWKGKFRTSENHALLEQVKVCAEVGINCKDYNPSNRPAIQDIIRRLDEMDISDTSVRSVPSTSLAGQLVDGVKSMTVSSALSQ